MSTVTITGRATVVGPVTGTHYDAAVTDLTEDGSPVLAFTHTVLAAMVDAGDAEDSNGYGLRHAPFGAFVDTFSDTESAPVPTHTATLFGLTLHLYAPTGRVWDLAEPMDVLAPIDDEDEPVGCLPDPSDDALDLIADAHREARHALDDGDADGARDALSAIGAALTRTGRA